MANATRARRGKAAAKPVEEEVEDTAEDNGSVREPSEMHELMADFFNENYDAGVTPRQCAIYTSKRGAFRRSKEYLEYRDAAKSEVAERKASRSKGRTPEPEEDDEPEEKPAARSRRRKPSVPAEEAPVAKPAAPARRARGRAKPAAEDEEAEQEETPAKPAPRRRRSPRPATGSEDEPF